MASVAAVLVVGLLLLVVPVAHAAKWTVLVYLMGDNSLDCFALYNLNALASVRGAGSEVNFFVLADLASQQTSCTGVYNGKSVGGVSLWAGAKASIAEDFALQSDGSLKTLKTYGVLDLADPSVLRAFIARGIQSYPADHYFLILWDHGGGWSGYGLDDTPGQQYQDNGQTYTGPTGTLTMPQIGDVVSGALSDAGVQKLDIIGFDACLMQTYDANTALAPYTNYVVASQELEPGTGWDYSVFQQLVNNPSMSALDISKVIADGYLALSLETGATVISLAVADMSKFATLASSMDTLANSMSKAFNSSLASLIVDVGLVRGAAVEMVEFSSTLNAQYSLIDLGEFLSKLQPSYGELDSQATQALAGAGTAASQAYNDTIVYVVRDRFELFQGATGMSIYFPRKVSDYSASYTSYVGGGGRWVGTLGAFYNSASILQRTDANPLSWGPAQQIEIVNLPDYPNEPDITARVNLTNPDRAGFVELYAGYNFNNQILFVASSYATVDLGSGVVTGTWDGYIFSLEQDGGLFHSAKTATVYASQQVVGTGSDEVLQVTFDVAYTPSGSSQQPLKGTLQLQYNYTSGTSSPLILYVLQGDSISQIPSSQGGTLRPLVYATDPGSQSFTTFGPAYLTNEDLLDWSADNPIKLTKRHVLNNSVKSYTCSDLRLVLVANDWAQRELAATVSGAQVGCITANASSTSTPGPRFTGNSATGMQPPRMLLLPMLLSCIIMLGRLL
eukprot:jgi/Chlat1/3761/Chrsp259S03904